MLFVAVSDDLDGTIFTLSVEFLELTFFLVIGKRSDHDNNDDGDDNGDTLDPFERGDLATLGTAFVPDNVRGTSGGSLVDTECEGNDSCDGQEDLGVD